MNRVQFSLSDKQTDTFAGQTVIPMQYTYVCMHWLYMIRSRSTADIHTNLELVNSLSFVHMSYSYK